MDKNETLDLIKFSARNQKQKKNVGRKWVFKKKGNEEGKVEKHKSRLVEKGYILK